jgi:hypothetical protein
MTGFAFVLWITIGSAPAYSRGEFPDYARCTEAGIGDAGRTALMIFFTTPIGRLRAAAPAGARCRMYARASRSDARQRQISLNGSGLIAVYLTVFVIEAWPRKCCSRLVSIPLAASAYPVLWRIM